MQSALTAKLMLEEEFPEAKIHIVDSYNATGSQALLLMEAARMQQDGKSLEEVVSYLEQAKKRYPYHIYDWRPDSFAARRQNR